MALVSLSPTQVAILRNLAGADMDTVPVFREFVAAIKLQYGIPAEHKLKTLSDDRDSHQYAILVRKKTGDTYAINSTTGQWVDAPTPAPVQGPAPAAAPERKGWFVVGSLEHAGDLLLQITGDLDFDDRSDLPEDGVNEFYVDGCKFAAWDGEMYMELGESNF